MQDMEFKKKVLEPLDYESLEAAFGIPETATNLKDAIKDIINLVRHRRTYGCVGFGQYNPDTVYLDSHTDVNIVYQVAITLEIPVKVTFCDITHSFSAEFDAGEIDKDFAGIKIRSIIFESVMD